MTVQLDLIKNVAYFSGLSDAELESIRVHTFEKSVEKGQIVVYEGEPAEALYFVAGGVLKIFKTSAEGKEQILMLVRPGDSFNDVPVLEGGQNLTSAGAMMPVTLYEIRKTNFYDILKVNSKVALNAIQVLCQRVTHLVSLVEDLSFRQVTGRVAKILLEHAGAGSDQCHSFFYLPPVRLIGMLYGQAVRRKKVKCLVVEGLVFNLFHPTVDKKRLSMPAMDKAHR